MGSGEREIRPAQVSAESVDIYINSICNLNCRTCFLGDEYFDRGHTLTVEEIAAIAEWAVAAGARDVAVLGGEPTLHREIVEIFEALRCAGVEHRRLITNGSARARCLLAGPLRDLVNLPYVSLDGPTQATNDAVRGQGSFTQAVACIDLLRRQEREFVITSTLTSAAITELDALLALAEDSGASVLNVHWLSAVGRARDTDLPVSASVWLDACEYIREYRPKRRGLSIECQVGWRPTDRALSEGSNPQACLVRDLANLQFMPDGSVVSCGLLADDPKHHGFRWDGGRLIERAGETERRLCEDFDGEGCPVRQGWMGEGKDPLPLCIYERVTTRDD